MDNEEIKSMIANKGNFALRCLEDGEDPVSVLETLHDEIGSLLLKVQEECDD